MKRCAHCGDLFDDNFTTSSPMYYCRDCQRFINSLIKSKPKLTINSEPLSTKQLHELIVSQSMTIDRLLGEVGRYRSVLAEIVELLSKARRFTAWYKAKTILEEK